MTRWRFVVNILGFCFACLFMCFIFMAGADRD